MTRKRKTIINDAISNSVVKMYLSREVAVEKIQELHNISRSTMYRILQVRGVRVDRTHSRPKGKNRKVRVMVSPELHRRMFGLAQSGASVVEIKNICGVSYSTAKRYSERPVALTPVQPSIDEIAKRVHEINQQRVEPSPLPVTMIEPPSFWQRFKGWFGF